MPRRVLAFLTLLLLLSACGQADLSKKTFQRTTVPAAGGGTGATAQVHDSKLAEANLHLADPCGVLSPQLMSKYGAGPGTVDQTGYDECERSVKDPAGKMVSAKLSLGGAVSAQFTPFKSTIKTLPASESGSGSLCTETLLTDSDNSQGMEVEYYADGGTDLCAKARDIAGAVVDVLRNNPPQHQLGQGSLVTLKPCDELDGGTVNAVLGAPEDGSEVNFRQCGWEYSKAKLTLKFDLSKDNPANTSSGGAGGKVGLGNGVFGYKQASSDTLEPSCVLAWVHKTNQKTGANEIVNVEYDDKAKSKVDTCAKAAQAGSVLVTRLPKP